MNRKSNKIGKGNNTRTFDDDNEYMNNIANNLPEKTVKTTYQAILQTF